MPVRTSSRAIGPRRFEPRPEEGCLVTGTFEHLNRDIVELTFAGSDLRLQPTALHPLWSLDRDGWVRAGDLSPGERLKTDGGEVVVDGVRWLREPAQVYNLEVAGDHYYLVSEARVLSHNADGCEPSSKVNLLDVPPVKLGNPDKLRKQMRQRGWTKKSIREAMDTDGISTKGKNGSATRYAHPETGDPVVVDDATGEVFHVGKPGWKYDDYE